MYKYVNVSGYAEGWLVRRWWFFFQYVHVDVEESRSWWFWDEREAYMYLLNRLLSHGPVKRVKVGPDRIMRSELI